MSVNIKCPRADCDFETGENATAVSAALLTAHATEHNSGGGGGGSTRAPPVDRPRLQAACARADWEVFKARWKSFKAATNVRADKVVHQLLGSLDNDVITLVYNENGSPETLDESELLELIHKVAVKPENVWITREKLHQMTQDTAEPITGFAARLKGQARLCEFTQSTTCTNAGCGTSVKVDFTETVVMGELVRGIADPEVKTLVLGEVEPKIDLKSLVKLIQTKEYAKSTSAPQVVAELSGKSEGHSCDNCGKVHDKGRKNCPAYGKTCTNCEKKGHFRA